MDPNYFEKARDSIDNANVLVNMVSRRVRQLQAGERPLIKPDDPNMDMVDIALKEIAEGKLVAEMAFEKPDASDAGVSKDDQVISL